MRVSLLPMFSDRLNDLRCGTVIDDKKRLNFYSNLFGANRLKSDVRIFIVLFWYFLIINIQLNVEFVDQVY